MTFVAATTASLPSPTICCRVEVESVVIGYRAGRQFGQNADMGREEVMRWVAGYELAWREGDRRDPTAIQRYRTRQPAITGRGYGTRRRGCQSVVSMNALAIALVSDCESVTLAKRWSTPQSTLTRTTTGSCVVW